MENKYTKKEALEFGKMLDAALDRTSYCGATGGVSGSVNTFYGLLTGDFLADNCEILLKDYMQVITPNDAIKKLVSENTFNDVIKENMLNYIFKTKYEDLPLGINNKIGSVDIICNWRLKIGK